MGHNDLGVNSIHEEFVFMRTTDSAGHLGLAIPVKFATAITTAKRNSR
jgi:hypothetical protein